MRIMIGSISLFAEYVRKYKFNLDAVKSRVTAGMPCLYPPTPEDVAS